MIKIVDLADKILYVILYRMFEEVCHECCTFISKLCREAGCEKPSALCSKAAEAVLASEKKYLDICGQSCIKCGESRQPVHPRKPVRKSNKTIYVA